MHAIGYTRLSQDSDLSIPRQKRQIREFCEERGWTLEQIYDDGEFSSGYDDEREQYQKVRDRIQAGDIEALVVQHKDRIGRDFNERMRFILDLRESDVGLFSTKRGEIDLSDPTDAAVESVHAARDDEAKREEIKKATEAVEERLESGYYHGRPPYGLQFDEDGQYLEPDPEQWDALMDALELADDGASVREVSSETDIPKSTVGEILERGSDYYLSYAERTGGT